MGTHYCGQTLKWSYKQQYINLSKPKYIPNVLSRYTPFLISSAPTYSQYQNAIQKDSSPKLNAQDTTTAQQIVGCLLYYTYALHNTLLVALYTISQTESKPATATKRLCDHLLKYCATKPNVDLHYNASKMILSIDSDASILGTPKAKSRIAGFSSFFPPYNHLSTMPLSMQQS